MICALCTLTEKDSSISFAWLGSCGSFPSPYLLSVFNKTSGKVGNVSVGIWLILCHYFFNECHCPYVIILQSFEEN